MNTVANPISNSHSCFNTLQHSIKSNIYDYELLSKFQSLVKNLNLSESIVREYIELMINVYELSNYQGLFVIRKNSITAN